MSILFAASEFYPLAKTGGLGDVVAALPVALRAIGKPVSVVLPYYRSVHQSGIKTNDTRMGLTISMNGKSVEGRVLEARAASGVKLFLVEQNDYFDREHLYGGKEGDYPDNAERFSFFSKAVVQIAQRLQPAVELVHVHDWQTGLVPAMIRDAGVPIKTVFTIHNLAYQGDFPDVAFDWTGLPGSYFTPGGVEFYGRLNFMKAGLIYADQITTVSPTYAKEIQTPAFGCSLEGVLQERAGKLTGILNGIDSEIWSPKVDVHLAEKFSAGRLDGKRACRRALLRKVGWPETAPEMIIGIVTRLAGQKGMNLVQQAWPELAKLPVRIILLGSGEKELEIWFRGASVAYREKMHATLGFNEAFAHQIEAGSDVFLMPSHYEPCGLNQMYSQVYGTLPIVHRTGGLADSVVDWNETTREGTGFVFAPCTAAEMVKAVQRAVSLFGRHLDWNRAMMQAMRQDFSWQASAERYLEVYQHA